MEQAKCWKKKDHFDVFAMSKDIALIIECSTQESIGSKISKTVKTFNNYESH